MRTKSIDSVGFGRMPIPPFQKRICIADFARKGLDDDDDDGGTEKGGDIGERQHHSLQQILVDRGFWNDDATSGDLFDPS